MTIDFRLMTGTRMLRHQHLELERQLAKLDAHMSHRETKLAELAIELTAHLQVEASVFYPFAEATLRHPLLEQRQQNRRVRDAVRSAAGDRSLSFPRRALDLVEAFKRHCRIEEQTTYASLEAMVAERKLQALGIHLVIHHTALIKCLRAQAGRNLAPTQRDHSSN